ncbi:serine hydrolase domain-containing protein [Paenibacillus sp. NPDC057967]|uniref:serine hydrolase domain-containing protein n=1 Tax=Paenibacillus sp. NPDC057967 TaxID=3346293 RepID=UPI0036DAB0BA
MPDNEWTDYKDTSLQKAGDSASLSQLDGLIAAEYSNITGIVAVKDGSIVYENYYNGFGVGDKHHVASVTKSVLSALIGIAIDKGYIANEHAGVLDFFPEYTPSGSEADGQRENITLRHLLTMTAPYPFADWQEPLDQMCMQPDWIGYTLDMLGKGGEIGAFKYSTAGAHLLSAILTRTTGQSAREFANMHLFGLAGMQSIPNYPMKAYGFDELFGQEVRGWVHDPGHYSTGGWGLTLTTRDMARFGLLYLNHGKRDQRQIIPESWVAKSIAMNPNQYGYLWWLRNEDGLRSFSAMGDGGNVICCLPERHTVIAISSSFMVNPRDRWSLIKEQLLPVIK